MNALLYYRVSHEEQKKYGISLLDQRENLEKYCTEKGYNIKGTYHDDGVSAKDMKHRKGFQEMIKDALPGDVVLVTKIDRFSRKLYEALQMIEYLSERDISIIAIYEDDINTTTADGKLMLHLKLSLAEHELGRSSERIRRVMDYKRSKGEVTHGNLKLGYEVRDKHAVVVPEDADKVRWIFEDYISTHSLIKTKDNYNRTYNAKVTPGFIKGILDNDNYLGNITYPPIITEAIFNLVQDIRKNSYIRRPVDKSHEYLFSGLCFCGYCGLRMGAKTQKVKRVKATSRTDFSIYKCRNKNNGSGEKACCSITEDKLERIVLSEITHELQNVHVQSDYVKDGINVSDKIETLRSKEKRLKTLFIDGLIEHDDMIKQINAIKKEIINLEAQERKSDPLHIDSSALELYNQFDREQKAVFWKTIIKKIIIKKDGDVTIVYC